MGKDKFFAENIVDKIKLYEKTGKDFRTMFLDPAELSEVKRFLKDIEYTTFGGDEDAERKMIFVGKEYDFDNAMCVLEIEAKVQLNHRSVLGSLLAIGIKREVLGDIYVNGNIADIIIEKEISLFVLNNLEKVGRDFVKCIVKKISELTICKDNGKELHITVASNRLDTIICGGFAVSREESSELVRGQKVLVNHEVVINNSKKIEIDDIISVRGFGRLKLLSIDGTTKKDRLKISIIKY